VRLTQTKDLDPTLKKYLQEINSIPLLKKGEEFKLMKKIKNGDQIALKRLIEANLRFVVSVAKKYQGRSLSLCDIINEGNLGLITAAERFDENRGFKFISYAVWWIRQSILQALSENSRIVRVPFNRLGAISKIGKMTDSLEQKYKRKPHLNEIATALDRPIEEVTLNVHYAKWHQSLDAPVTNSNNEDYALINILQNSNTPSPDNELQEESLKTDIEHALQTLDQREAEIVRLYYGLVGERSLTLEEIGDIFSLTRERVRQIKEKAIQRLRHRSRSVALLAYLG